VVSVHVDDSVIYDADSLRGLSNREAALFLSLSLSLYAYGISITYFFAIIINFVIPYGILSP
jgi:hypothetical protein